MSFISRSLSAVLILPFVLCAAAQNTNPTVVVLTDRMPAWTSAFLGQIRCVHGGCATIESDGTVRVFYSLYGVDKNLGLPEGFTPLSYSSAQCSPNVNAWVYPLNSGYGASIFATDWAVRYVATPYTCTP